MAYAQSHKVEYKDCANIDTRIEIWEDGYSGSIVECEAAGDPLNIDIAPMDPTILVPVIGTGASIKLNSATSMQFTGLYTKQPLKRMIKVFKDNKSNPWWLGYINPEQYSEGYSLLTDYVVTINCNDGFNALNRFKYIESGGSHYTTLDTYWTILTRILTKMGLPFQYLYFACNINCNGITVDSDKTLFHYLRANQQNYYDEQDEPMTFRQVLEALLLSFGLQIRWHDGCIFVYKPQMLAASSFSAKRFDSSYAYVDTVSVSRNFNISNGDINWDNEDQNLDTVAGYNSQKIRYSPYMQQAAVKEVDLTDRDLWTGTETWTDDGYGVPRLSGITAIEGYILPMTCSLGGHRIEDSSKEEIYLDKTIDDDGAAVSVIATKHVAQKADQFLMFECEIFIRSKADEFGEDTSVMARAIHVPFYAKVGDKGASYNEGTEEYEWATGDGDEHFALIVSNNSDTLCDKWHTARAYIPWNMPGGLLLLIVRNPRIYETTVSSNRLYEADGLISSRTRNIKVRVYENGANIAGGLVSNPWRATEAPDDDEQYKGDLDDDFMNEGPEVTLPHADAKNITDQGGIAKLDESFTSQWQITGDSSWYRLTDLLLRAITSQYQESLSKLTGTIEAGALMGSNGGPGFIFTLQDTDYLSTKKHLFTGGSYNDYNRTLDGSFLEVKQEDVIINVE